MGRHVDFSEDLLLTFASSTRQSDIGYSYPIWIKEMNWEKNLKANWKFRVK